MPTTMTAPEADTRLTLLYRNREDIHWKNGHWRPSADQQVEYAARLVEINKEIEELENLWMELRWSRWWMVHGPRGHLHRTATCSSFKHTTTYSLIPELSGASVAEAVAKYGGDVCTVCCPEAPATEGYLEAKERAAELAEARQLAKEERLALKAAKTLESELVFRDHYGQKVTTVAAAKAALRESVGIATAVEHLKEYPTNKLAQWYARNADTSRQILEAATTALLAKLVSQEEISQISERAAARWRRDLRKAN